MRKWVRTIKIPLDEYDPGLPHVALNISAEQCQELMETEDGCPACEEAYTEASDLAIEKLEKKGLAVWDIMLVNRPGLGINEDRFWEFECVVMRED